MYTTSGFVFHCTMCTPLALYISVFWLVKKYNIMLRRKWTLCVYSIHYSDEGVKEYSFSYSIYMSVDATVIPKLLFFLAVMSYKVNIKHPMHRIPIHIAHMMVVQSPKKSWARLMAHHTFFRQCKTITHNIYRYPAHRVSYIHYPSPWH